ncbi:hypothetical protein MKD38_06200 [Cupriavidus sp. WGlv3]|uniref:hypothetical protein n=1 Tax=Cupriavidus sp. WGlv3 TaxID=2919924 RepID=UPI0020915228|nr:hypothetical protein [Cupriavidus sp. WGlv3]MCO4861253.1 hypothetical protein [Cupriavidus sp. WGlv3]
MTLDTRLGILIRLYEKLKGWIFRAPKPSYEAAHPTLNPIDIEQLTIELRLREEGERLGHQGVPNQTSTVLSGPEMAVVHRVEKQRQEYMQWGAIRLSNVNNDIHSCNLIQRINSALAAGESFESNVNAIITRKDTQLESLAQAKHQKHVQLERFRATNGLTRDAIVPSGLSKWSKRIGLLVCVLFEGVLNAKFFAQGLDDGLLGGFFYAFALAFVNVLFAFGIGRYLLPNLWHQRFEWKLMGMVGLVFIVASVGGVGLAIAHFRDTLTAGIPDAEAAALHALKESPFKLRDIMSWLLFLLSACFGLSAGYAGLSFLDRYPGYTAITEEADKASDEYEEELEDLRDELDRERDDAVAALESTLHDSQEALRGLSAAIRTKRDSGIDFLHVMQEAERALASLLMTFRTENTVARGGVPAPAYFNEIPRLQELPLPDFTVEQDKAILTQQEALVADLLKGEQGIRSRIQNAFNQKYQLVRPLKAQFPQASVGPTSETPASASGTVLGS